MSLAEPRRPSSPGKLNRRKTSELVCEYVARSIFDGTLRSGERVDINEVADYLGVSTIPVREALISLVADGLLESQYHRPAVVAHLSERSVREHFDLYAVLVGEAVTALAQSPDLEATLVELEAVVSRLADTPASARREWDATAREFIAIIVDAVAGPKLRSMLASFRHVLPHAVTTLGPSMNERGVELMRGQLERLRVGDGPGAAALERQHLLDLGTEFVQVLRERGVLS